MNADADSVHVLHVDDDPAFAALAREYLQRYAPRITVEFAENATDALDELSGTEFDCVVSDYDMPGQDGIEFLSAVRERDPELPFILFTGKGSEEIASEAISAGVTDYIQKESGTSQYELLANRITNVVEQRQAQAEIAETEQRLVTIAENSNDILWKFTADWDELLFINSPYEEIWGKSIEELEKRPRSFLEGIHPDDRQRVRDAMEQLSGGESVDLEYRVNPEEDFGRWVWVQGEPVFADDGTVEKVVGFARDITERTRRSRQVEALLEHTKDVIVVIDTESTIQFATAAVERVFGYDVDDVVGEPLTMLMPERFRDQHRRAIDRYLDTGERTLDWSGIELPGLHENGHEIDLHVSFSELDGADGHRFAGVIRDVTEAADGPGALQRSEKRFRTLFEQSADAIYLHDEDGTIRDVNHQACDQLGYRAEELVGKRVWDISADPNPEGVRARWAELAPGDVLTFDGRHQRKDGSTFPVQVRVSLVELDAGPQFVAAARDVTEQTERERELEQFETIVETVPVGVFVLDEAGTVVRANSRVADILGAELDEQVGASFQRLIDDGTFDEAVVESYLGHVRRLLSSDTDDEQARFEQTVTVDGRERVIEVTLSLRPYEETYRGTVGVLRDITDQRRQTRELRRQNERLGEFASVISHDLRNPLNVAAGRLDLARAECDSDHLDEVDGALERMDSLVENVLSLARAGESIGETRSIDMAALAEGCWQTVDTADATLRIETERSVRADESRLRQLLANLFRNAVQHSSGGVTVTVGDLADGFYVADTGPGIPAEDRDDVFQSGYSTSAAGTGFGLNIAREIAEAHGWEIAVGESDAGGARFEITGV